MKSLLFLNWLLHTMLFLICFGILCLILLATLASAETVALQWNKAKDAASYELEMSGDFGVNWEILRPPVTCLVTICKTTVNVLDDRIVLIRVVSVNAAGRAPRADRGIWACTPCRLASGVMNQKTP